MKKQYKQSLKKYPDKVCPKCGIKAMRQNNFSIGPMANTVMEGICDVCGKITRVSTPGDYKHPTFKGHEPSIKVGIHFWD